MSKRVRQTITIDIERLENTFVWHLNLDDTLQKLSELEHVKRLGNDEILDLIRECRLQLTGLDMTLSEFQEIYEALTGEEPTPTSVPEPEPELLQEDLEKEINDRMIGNLLSNLDSTKK
jgi:hypothetical protein|tara:strand:- start:33 stop:389 length:357 start_codon:yes stop_codon:yes gene_type:complete